MPHMMPMMWLTMLLFSLILLFLIISMLYFFYFPVKDNYFSSTIKQIKWNWKW